MYIPVWGLFAFAVIWIGSMYHLNKTGFEAGWREGTMHGITTAVNFMKVNNLINEYKPNEISIESPFYGKNVQSMLKLGRAQGVAMVAGEINNITITEYAPKKIKQAVTGNGNASKVQLNKMIQKILNIKILDSNKLDASDALGAALCHLYQKSNNQTTKKSWKQYLISNPDKLV